MVIEHFESPEFIEVPLGERTLCVSLEDAISRPELCQQVIQAALAEADEWNQRFGAFFERIDEPAARAIVEAIRRAKDARRQRDEFEGGIEFSSGENLA